MVQKGKEGKGRREERKRRGKEGGRELSGEERKVQKEDVGKQGEQCGTREGGRAVKEPDWREEEEDGRAGME